MFQFIVGILYFVLAITAIPTDLANEKVTLSKRNPCDGINAEPVLYKKYDGSQCPPKHRLVPDKRPNSKDKLCEGWDSIANQCSTFCQTGKIPLS